VVPAGVEVDGPARAERPSFSALYRAHVQQVSRWACRLAGPTIEAEDVVQEVFMIAHRQLPTFRGDSQASTWLFGITQNVVRHRRRKENVRRWLLAAVSNAGSDAPAPPARPTPVEELERREATATVYRALDGLGEKYRTVFILFELEGLTGPEIAGLLGLPAATLRVRLFRARALFADRLRVVQAEQAARAEAGRPESKPAADTRARAQRTGPRLRSALEASAASAPGANPRASDDPSDDEGRRS
jgi:RNA polymerase sigma-70 factor (ECF subfamily)